MARAGLCHVAARRARSIDASGIVKPLWEALTNVRSTSAPAVRCAQIPLVPCRPRERVISDPLLPFPVGPGTGEERHDLPFREDATDASVPPEARVPGRSLYGRNAVTSGGWRSRTNKGPNVGLLASADAGRRLCGTAGALRYALRRESRVRKAANVNKEHDGVFGHRDAVNVPSQVPEPHQLTTRQRRFGPCFPVDFSGRRLENRRRTAYAVFTCLKLGVQNCRACARPLWVEARYANSRSHADDCLIGTARSQELG